MKFKKIALFSALIILTVLMVPLVSACKGPVPCRPTSLEVWKEISCVDVWCDDGVWYVTMSGFIHIQNDPWNPARILHVVDYVEAKWRGNDWVTLATKTVRNPSDGVTIEPGATIDVWFRITFEKGTYTAYRNVVKVHLENHPTGDRWYTYRLSFDIP